MVASAALLLTMAGGLASLGVERLQRLAARLVHEEVHRHLATEKGAELEQANQQIALINADLEEQQQRLVIAQRESETLTSLLVHDMKQPLSSVLALVELAASDLVSLPGGAPLMKDLEMARTQAQRLLAMIGDLLAVSRLEKGTLEPRPEPTAVGPLLQAVAAQAVGSRAQVSVRAEADLVVPLDRALAERMLENLMSNALAFVKPGGAVELSAARVGDDLVLAVKNDGPAVPIEARPNLFEKFSHRPGDRHSSGLGLYFCRLVAEAHRGRIALDADATFAVAFVARLPAAGPRPGRKT